jgi:hypothetical protein
MYLNQQGDGRRQPYDSPEPFVEMLARGLMGQALAGFRVPLGERDSSPQSTAELVISWSTPQQYYTHKCVC